MTLTWEEFKAKVDAALQEAGETSDIEVEYIDISIIYDDIDIIIDENKCLVIQS